MYICDMRKIYENISRFLMFDGEEDTSNGFVDITGNNREDSYQRIVEPYLDRIWGGFVHNDNQPYGELFGKVVLGVDDEDFDGPIDLVSFVPGEEPDTHHHFHELNADVIAEVLKKLPKGFKAVIDGGAILTGTPESLRTVIDRTEWSVLSIPPKSDNDPRGEVELPSVIFHSTDPRRPMPAGIDIEEAKKRFCDMLIWYAPLGDNIEIVRHTSHDTEGIEDFLNNNYLPDEAWEMEGNTPPTGNMNENLQNFITFEDDEDTSTGFVDITSGRRYEGRYSDSIDSFLTAVAYYLEKACKTSIFVTAVEENDYENVYAPEIQFSGGNAFPISDAGFVISLPEDYFELDTDEQIRLVLKYFPELVEHGTDFWYDQAIEWAFTENDRPSPEWEQTFKTRMDELLKGLQEISRDPYVLDGTLNESMTKWVSFDDEEDVSSGFVDVGYNDKSLFFTDDVDVFLACCDQFITDNLGIEVSLEIVDIGTYYDYSYDVGEGMGLVVSADSKYHTVDAMMFAALSDNYEHVPGEEKIKYCVECIGELADVDPEDWYDTIIEHYNYEDDEYEEFDDEIIDNEVRDFYEKLRVILNKIYHKPNIVKNQEFLTESVSSLVSFDDEDSSTGFVGMSNPIEKSNGIRYLCEVCRYRSNTLDFPNPFRTHQKMPGRGNYWEQEIYDAGNGHYGVDIEQIYENIETDAGYEDTFNENMSIVGGDWFLTAHTSDLTPEFENEPFDVPVELGDGSEGADTREMLKRAYVEKWSKEEYINEIVENYRQSLKGDMGPDAHRDAVMEDMEEEGIKEPDYMSPGYDEYEKEVERRCNERWDEMIGNWIYTFLWQISEYMKEIINNV